jgi:hypothetical protein
MEAKANQQGGAAIKRAKALAKEGKVCVCVCERERR